MRLTRKSWLLLLAVALLLALNLLDAGGPPEATALPALPALVRESVTRIELSDASNKTTLRRDEAGWRVTSPYDAAADAAEVGNLLATFRKEIGIDVQVDVGNYEAYGLEPGRGVVVEIWTDGEDPALSFTVGEDTSGGSSFVRLSGSEAIYRARVGGRERYARPPVEWRNKVLLDFTASSISGLFLRHGDETRLALVRRASTELAPDGQPIPGAWTLDPTPPWPVDQTAGDTLAGALAGLRAEAVLSAEFNGGFDPPAIAAEVVLDDGTLHTLSLGSRAAENGGFVRVGEGGPVYRVGARPAALLTVTSADLRNLSLLRFQRADVDLLALEEGRDRVILRQDPTTGLWVVLQPDNVDLDIQRVLEAVNALANLRAVGAADGVTAAAAGLNAPALVFSVTFADGSSAAIEIGGETTDAAGQPARYVRRAGAPGVFLLRQRLIDGLRRAFGRM